MYNHFHHFKTNILGIKLPEKFTFPFYYEPHQLCKLAAKEVQEYLATQTDFTHNFGLKKENSSEAIGKMFGVLVVKNQQGEIGFLSAFSGMFSDNSIPVFFVPPVFHRYQKGSFYPVGEGKLNQLNLKISALKNNTDFITIQQQYQQQKQAIETELQQEKNRLKQAKKDRKQRRKEAEENLSKSELQAFLQQLQQESYNQQFYLKELTEYKRQQLAIIEKKWIFFTEKLSELKKARKELSNTLQAQLFAKYQFLNQQKETKGVVEIFKELPVKTPPAGSGDCAAPRLLQYAFAHHLQPICMAEFWWGTSPNKAIRKHQQFYPSCQSRCKPILAHMLSGIEMDENPLLKNPAKNKILTFLYEDDDLVVINKPAEFLSVPGKEITDSVATRMKAKYPNATGPLVVHRLDMSTSGILLIAKSMDIYKKLQSQFINRTVKKRYVAVLDGVLQKKSGTMNLPLRVDLDDRPRQLVCFEHGKAATTKWNVIEKKDDKTRVHFYPITGRTHQLRVHAAHSLGLNTPILGDDLYGTKAHRLHLHADYIEFEHPSTKKRMQFQVDANF